MAYTFCLLCEKVNKIIKFCGSYDFSGRDELGLFSSLDPRAVGELIGWSIVCRPSSTFSKDFFSETTGPVSFKFHVQPPGKGGKKIYTFRPGLP